MHEQSLTAHQDLPLLTRLRPPATRCALELAALQTHLSAGPSHASAPTAAPRTVEGCPLTLHICASPLRLPLGDIVDLRPAAAECSFGSEELLHCRRKRRPSRSLLGASFRPIPLLLQLHRVTLHWPHAAKQRTCWAWGAPDAEMLRGYTTTSSSSQAGPELRAAASR